MQNNKIGNTIKKTRIKRNLSQKELGEMIGVTNKTISKWENETHYPDPDTLIRLSSTLRITVDELVKGETNNDYDIDKFNLVLSSSRIKIAQAIKSNLIRIIVTLAVLIFISIMIFVFSYSVDVDNIYVFRFISVVMLFAAIISFLLYTYKHRDNLKALIFKYENSFLFESIRINTS